MRFSKLPSPKNRQVALCETVALAGFQKQRGRREAKCKTAALVGVQKQRGRREAKCETEAVVDVQMERGGWEANSPACPWWDSALEIKQHGEWPSRKRSPL